MIIRNLTYGEKAQNIMITSLKNEYLKDEHCLQPGEYFDTEKYNFTDTKVMKSNELKQLEQAGLVGIFQSLEEEKEKRSEEIKKQKEWGQKKARQEILDQIESTDSLTALEDYISKSNDPEIVKIARKRLSQLTGDEGPENKELDGKTNNPMV
jgi:hypothetical protein